YVLGAVTHGFELGGEEPSSVGEMRDALVALGYDRHSIAFDWAARSNLPKPGQATGSGDDLGQEILREAECIGAGPNDVIDVHLIGHSPGSIVISQAATYLDPARPNQLPQLRRSFVKMTMLDPHPANDRPLFSDPLFDSAALDPPPVPDEVRATARA